MWKYGSTARMVSCSVKPSKFCMPRHWQRLATRFSCVSMTPLGRPVVPLEYGSTTTSRRASMATDGGLGGAAGSTADGQAPHPAPPPNPDPPLATRPAGPPPRLVQEGPDRHQEALPRVLELLDQLVGGVERVDGRVDAAEGRDRVEGHRVLREVRAVDREDVALLEPAAGQARGRAADAVGE